MNSFIKQKKKKKEKKKKYRLQNDANQHFAKQLI